MRTKLLLCVCVVVLTAFVEAQSRNSPENDDFNSYKKHHSKVYKHDQEEKTAMEHFHRNRESVKKHNEKHKKGEKKFTLELNKFADLPPSVLDGMNGLIVPDAWLQKMQKLNRRRRGKTVALAGFDDLPAPPKKFDWRSKNKTNYVTPAKAQGHCGDCYAFATVGALESQILIKGLAEKSFSEEQIADCFKSDSDPNKRGNYKGTNGCSGGFPVDALQYLENIGGITTEDVYPYTLKKSSVSNPCTFDPKTAVQKILSHGSAHAPDDQTLKKLLVNKGPLVVSINAEDLHFYESGVFQSEKMKVDHAVLLIGYGNDKDGNGDYWIIKNSWGSDWGLQGDGTFKLSMDRTENAGLTGDKSAIVWAEIDNA